MSDSGTAPASGKLTREILDAGLAAIKKQSVTRPRHDCRFDRHVLAFNPWGFSACIYCNVSEAEIARPEDPA